jgi:hypothetical protein
MFHLLQEPLREVLDIFTFKWGKEKTLTIGEELRGIADDKENPAKFCAAYLEEVINPFYHELKTRAEVLGIREVHLYWNMAYIYPPKRLGRHSFVVFHMKRPDTIFPRHPQPDTIRKALERRFLDDGLQVVYQKDESKDYIFTVRW